MKVKGYSFSFSDKDGLEFVEDGDCKFYDIGVVPIPVGQRLKSAMRIGRKIILNTNKVEGIVIRRISEKELARRLK